MKQKSSLLYVLFEIFIIQPFVERKQLVTSSILGGERGNDHRLATLFNSELKIYVATPSLERRDTCTNL